MESCCTCARLLSAAPRHPPSSSSDEKPLPDDRRPACCGRVICGACIRGNPRFGAYCPYCQIGESSALLPPGLRAPPSYDASVTPGVGTNTAHPSTCRDRDRDRDPPPPPYTISAHDAPPTDPRSSGKSERPASGEDKTGGKERADADADAAPPQDTLHYLRQPHDTVASLSLQYGVPAAALRRANGIHSDHLIAGRRTVVIPAGYGHGHGHPSGSGVPQSLSPRPPGGEEAERRERALRRWMLRCRVHDYDVALLYLANAAWDPEAAVAAYLADEEWERAHPVEEARRRRGWGWGRVK